MRLAGGRQRIETQRWKRRVQGRGVGTIILLRRQTDGQSDPSLPQYEDDASRWRDIDPLRAARLLPLSSLIAARRSLARSLFHTAPRFPSWTT
uniref:Uncharacterized protein n=1 Tax=Plectus sambesii TaxID=2011161 RepID=A0A914VPE9_9BILA